MEILNLLKVKTKMKLLKLECVIKMFDYLMTCYICCLYKIVVVKLALHSSIVQHSTVLTGASYCTVYSFQGLYNRII